MCRCKQYMKWSESRSVVSDSLWHHGLYSSRNSPGQNTVVVSLSLLQLIFPDQELNPRPPALGAQSLSHWTTGEVPWPVSILPATCSRDQVCPLPQLMADLTPALPANLLKETSALMMVLNWGAVREVPQLLFSLVTEEPAWCQFPLLLVASFREKAKIATMPCLPSAVNGGLLLQDPLFQLWKIPYPVNRWCLCPCLWSLLSWGWATSRFVGLWGATQHFCVNIWKTVVWYTTRILTSI